MSSLLFLCELLAFGLVAYWTYVNDASGAEGGSKGLLRMIEPQGDEAPATRKRGARWRRAEAGERARSERAPRRAQGGRSQPAWKRRPG